MPPAWECANPFVRRVIEFDPAVGLYTTQLVHALTGTDLLRSARADRRWTPEFDFCVDGERVTSLDGAWDLEAVTDHFPETDFGAPLVVRLRHRTRALAVCVGYRCEGPRLDKRCWIENTGRDAVTITRLAVEALPVEIGAPGDLQVWAHYGAWPRETFITGRVDDCAVVYRNPRTGESVTALNQAPGHLKRTETGGWFWDGFVRLMYDTDLFPLERQLPAETGWAPAAMSLVFAVDGGAADPRWVLPAATAAGRRKPAAPAWHYNTWDPFGTRIDAATVAALVPLAARMGFDVFTIDDGWQAHYGDNAGSAERFPGGLHGLRDLVDAHGLRLGLWAPLAVVDEAELAATPALRAAQCRDARGRPKTTLTAAGEQMVMCLAGGYAPLAAARLIELVERYRLAYLKLDLTTVFNAYGEAPGCHAAGHEHASAAESVARIYEAIAAVTGAVYARCPDVLIDLTFELWGQKHTIDYALLRASDLAWISNVGDNTDDAAGPRQARTLLYQRALAIPAETMLIGNLRADTGDPREKFATALGAAPLLLGDLRGLSGEVVEWYGRMLRWHKDLRGAVALDESFFPLGSWAPPSVVAWDGFARLSREGEGVVVLFRNASTAVSARVQAPLVGDRTYRLRSVLTGAVLAVRAAADFRAGFELAFEPTEPVLIVEVRAEAG